MFTLPNGSIEQRNSNRNPSRIVFFSYFGRNQQTSSEIYMERQRKYNCPNNYEKDKRSLKTHTTQLQVLLQIYSNQGSTKLAKG